MLGRNPRQTRNKEKTETQQTINNFNNGINTINLYGNRDKTRCESKSEKCNY